MFQLWSSYLENFKTLKKKIKKKSKFLFPFNAIYDFRWIGKNL